MSKNERERESAQDKVQRPSRGLVPCWALAGEGMEERPPAPTNPCPSL